MLTVKEILGLRPKPTEWKRRQAERVEILGPAAKPRRQLDLAYEDEVLTFLFANREALGIAKVFRLKNQRMDGELELVNGDRVAIEIKYRMNWLRACQCGEQFRQFLALNAKTHPRV